MQTFNSILIDQIQVRLGGAQPNISLVACALSPELSGQAKPLQLAPVLQVATKTPNSE